MSSRTPVWFVIGASSGFGQAIAKEALARGHKVVAVSRRPEAMADLKEAGAAVMALDVTDSSEVLKAKVKEVVEVNGYITHVINGVGYALGGANEAVTDADATQELLTNVLGTMKMARLVTPYLREQHFGVIANFGSVGSWTAAPGMAHYAASKWAVSGFSESLTEELAPFGISVICVEPGYFRTAFLNSGHVAWAADRMEEVYAGTPADHYRNLAEQYNNNQPGDVNKAVPLLVDVLTKTGASKGRDIPLRLILGSDCYADVTEKCKSTIALLDEWKDISLATDHAK